MTDDAEKLPSAGLKRRTYVGLLLVIVVTAGLETYLFLSPPPSSCVGPSDSFSTTYLRTPLTFARPLGNRSLFFGVAEEKVIVVGNTWYMYYRNDTSKLGGPLNSSIWIATSSDGLNWETPRMVLGPSPTGWDSAETIAPSILQDGRRFYLYYEATSSSNNSIRAIGLAIADDPTGPL